MKTEEYIRSSEWYNLLSQMHKGIRNCYMNSDNTHLNISHNDLKTLNKIAFDLVLSGMKLESIQEPCKENPYCDGSYMARFKKA